MSLFLQIVLQMIPNLPTGFIHKSGCKVAGVVAS